MPYYKITMAEAYTTLFYADDDEDDRMFFEEVAQQIGESISLFELGDHMLLKLQNPPPSPSLIFLDLNMPIKDGFEVLAEIKASSSLKHVPVIILSTAGNAETVEKCFNLGASLYVRKTMSIADLKKAVEYVLSINWEKQHITMDSFLYKG
ncbi:response regulator [Flavobacterium chungangensis]|uniref:Response regulator n=1 Tax=Flavobacterium chungangensis TaxID=2708132 RepID=A0ABV8ZIQ0_9FLAO